MGALGAMGGGAADTGTGGGTGGGGWCMGCAARCGCSNERIDDSSDPSRIAFAAPALASAADAAATYDDALPTVSVAGKSGCTNADTWPRDDRRGADKPFAIAAATAAIVAAVADAVVVAVRSICPASTATAAAAAEFEFRAGEAGSELDAIETPIVDSCADAASLSDDATRTIVIGIKLELELAIELAPPPSCAMALVCALLPTLALALPLALALIPSVAPSAAADNGADRTGELPADRVGSVPPRAVIEGRPDDEEAEGLRCNKERRGRKGDTKHQDTFEFGGEWQKQKIIKPHIASRRTLTAAPIQITNATLQAYRHGRRRGHKCLRHRFSRALGSRRHCRGRMAKHATVCAHTTD